jgi:predicted transcriptional regulator
MSTTTIRLPPQLKSRLTAAANRAGKTPHSFILEAIAEKTEREERRSELDEAAETRYAELVTSGKSVPWSEMRKYLQTRAEGKPARRPVPRKLAR